MVADDRKKVPEAKHSIGLLRCEQRHQSASGRIGVAGPSFPNWQNSRRDMGLDRRKLSADVRR
jgi:hypothetical protein